MNHKVFSLLSVIALITGLFAPLSYGSVQAAPNATTSVTIAGSFQSELGCSGGVNGDWDPACASTHLTYDANDDVWQASFEIPAGSWEYKAALNDSWTENYGANATPGGDNIPLVLTQTTTVKFYYDDKSHWVTDNANAVIATVPGDFQKSLGCANDWEPSCLRSWLQDPDGNGSYTFETTQIPAGDYEAKVAIDESWDENYGQNGARDGANIPFSVPQDGTTVLFRYDPIPHLLNIQVGSGGPAYDNNVWWDGLAHDSRDSLYRQPFGAVPTDTPITLRFRTFAHDVTSVQLRLWDTAKSIQRLIPMQSVATISDEAGDYELWEAKLTAPSYLTILYYRFIVTDGTDTDYYEDDELMDGGLGQAYDDSVDRSWQIDVYDPNFSTPDWFKDAVVYQIFPDRFRNGLTANDPVSGTFFYDETPGVLTAPQWNWPVPDPRVSGPWEGSYSKLFYGGDLQGILDELDMLQSLGVNTLYLNPIFESPSNHKYDTSNYEQIDDNLGDTTTFISLTTALHQRGMHLILDGVFNHTSSDSRYFDRYGRYDTVGACESPTSTYRSWYYFHDVTPGTGECAGSDGTPNAATYDAWWGFKSLPKLNTTDNPGVRTYIYSGTTAFTNTDAIATHWLKLGADGWRLDVAGDVDASFWKDWRDDIRRADPNAVTLAEEWNDASRFILGDELDGAMNYRFRNAVIGLLRDSDWHDTNSTIKHLSISQFDRVMHGIEEDYPPQAFYAMMNLVDSHDTNRVLIPLDQDGDPTDADYSDGKTRLKLLAIIQMTMPGAPTIYYGDEVGLVGYGQDTATNEGGVFYSDPYNRQPYPWPDEPGYNSLPAWRKQDLSLRRHYSTTIAIRNAHPALRTGSFDTLLTDDNTAIYAYGRKLADDAEVVVLNLGTETRNVTLNVRGYLPEGVHLSDALNNGTTYTVTNGLLSLSIPAKWGAILTVDAGQPLAAPAPPTNLTAVEDSGSVALSWSASVSSTASYRIYRSYVSGGGYTLLDEVTGTSYQDATVTNGTTYFYIVTAVDAAKMESQPSNEVSALPHYAIDSAKLDHPLSLTHTVGITPTAPIYGLVTINGVTSVAGSTAGLLAQLGYGLTPTDYLSWTQWVDATYTGDVGDSDQYQAQLIPEASGTYYYLYRFSTTNGRDWVYADQNGTAILPPQPGVMHVQPADDTTAPPAPQNLRVIHWGVDHITTQWDAVTTPDLYGYDLYRYGEGQTAAEAVKVARILSPTVTYTDTAITAGQSYTYTVQALDVSLNRSPMSAPASGTAEARLVTIRFCITIPPFTPTDDTVYIAGNNSDAFGAEWTPGHQPMTKMSATRWAYTATVADGTTLEYKFTRGSWDTVENWGTLVGTSNRHLTALYGANGTMQVDDVVYNWRDPLVVETVPPSNAATWDTTQPVQALLSRPLDAGRITTATFILSDTTHRLSGTLLVTAEHFEPYPSTAVLPYIEGTRVTFTPTVALTFTQRYTVTLIKSGYHDDVDMQRDYIWNFGAQPTHYDLYLPLITRNS